MGVDDAETVGKLGVVCERLRGLVVTAQQETKEQYEARMRDAKSAHERRLDGAKIHASQIQAFAADAMKAPALVALGGVVALLGFYSANFSRLSENAVAMDAFGKMLFWLFTCLVFTVIAPGLAYLSQIAYTQSLYDEEHHFEWPFVRATKRSKFFGCVGDTFRWTAVVMVIGSIVCLIRSGVLFFHVVT